MKNIFKNFKKWMLLSPVPRFAQKIELSIMLEGKRLEHEMNIYFHNNRYFLPLSEIVMELGGSFSFRDGKLYIRLRKRETLADFKDGNYKAILFNNVLYVSLSQIVKLLDLKTRWKYNDNEIELYFNRENADYDKYEKTDKRYGTALIRLEDFTAGPPYDTEDNLQKVRIMVDYLYKKKVPFHVAWIPRYVDPENNIDNDISKSFNMANADFLFTLDYMTERGGTVGLHGYTHQYGDEVSGDGTEFNEKRNNDEKSVRNRLESAIACAKRLEIPYAFFESPHYAATEFQQSIMEQYFDYIYEPCVGIWGDKVILSPRNRKSLYVPTPLGYVSGRLSIGKMVLRILKLEEGELGSLFYHPSEELDFIQLSLEDGYPAFSYSEDSPLHRIVEAFESKRYKTVSIKNLRI